MKKLNQLLFVFLLCLISSSAISQDFWEQLYFPDTTDIYCITTNNAGDIFVGTGGQNSGVYKSVDDGNTWDLIIDNSTFSVLSIDINSQGDIYVGKGGFTKFIKSTDNGNSWDTLNMPVFSTGTFTNIYCQGNDTLYIGTWEDGGGLLSRSTDGGYTWDSLFMSQGYPGDHITDIVISSGGDIYLSIMGFSNNTGGVYKSADNGITWDFLGLLNHQVRALAINNNDEIFTGDWYTMLEEIPGIYALYNDSDTLQIIRGSNSVTDIAINSDGHIYILNGLGILRSMDNGDNFEYVNEGVYGNFNKIHIDINGYAYITKTQSIYRSINTTVSIDEINSCEHISNVYPNPFTDIINLQINNTKKSIKRIIITNLQNEIVIERNISVIDDLIVINTINLPKGIYFLEVDYKLSKEIIKIIK